MESVVRVFAPTNSPMQLTAPLILASQSPRRRTLLAQLNLSFMVQVSPANEFMREVPPPADYVEELALRKVRPVADDHPEALTLAADTVVALDDDILEKPANPAAARQMLRRLSGETHTVYTGLALMHRASGRVDAEVFSTDVTMASLSDDEIDAYVATGSPLDKAGGYGIQDAMGPLFVEHIAGDYYTVMGLPLRGLYQLLRRSFGDLVAW
nr:Maf family protein [Salisaeta longa]